MPKLRLTSITIHSAAPRELAAFYSRLLRWPVFAEDPPDAGRTGWVQLRPPAGEPEYVAPVWPSTPGTQQSMEHLDIEVDDLEASLAHAIAVGAVLADHQPQDDVRVCLDPAGHPFCLFTAG